MHETDIDERAPLVFITGIPRNAPDTRLPYQKQIAVYLILASVLFERVAFYSLAANLVITLQSSELVWYSRHSLTAAYIFFGTSYISTLLFAIISDAKLSRAKTIILGFIPYLIGYIIVILISNETTHHSICGKATSFDHTSLFSEHCGPQIIGTLITIAIGCGAVKSNIAVFGAEQQQESKVTSRYFDQYIVAVNIGGIIATLAVSYIQKADSNSYFIGYIIATSLLFIAVLLFIFGYRYYIHIKPHDTVVTNCIPVVLNAFQTWLEYKRKRNSIKKNRINSSSNNLLSHQNNITENEESMGGYEEPSTFLDFANSAHHGNFPDRVVNDVKSLRSAFIVFLLLIPYWLIYDQVQTSFLQQGQQMKIPIIGRNHEMMPIVWMSLGDPVTIITGIIILNVFMYKYFDFRNRAKIITRKFVIGMIFASVCMCIAGTVEIFRQDRCPLDPSGIPLNGTSTLTIFTQIPQNICMGFAELFATVASYEYAYYAAPRSGQSLFMSLRFCSVGVASFIGSAYVYLFPTPNDTLDFKCANNENKWSFYTYFFVLAALQLMFVIVLIVLHIKYRIVKTNPQQTVEKHFVSQEPSQIIDEE